VLRDQPREATGQRLSYSSANSSQADVARGSGGDASYTLAARPGQPAKAGPQPARAAAAGGAPATGSAEPVVRGDKVGRNDPCPCGSGLKYKRCHGAT
jgi:hypothetical protein